MLIQIISSGVKQLKYIAISCLTTVELDKVIIEYHHLFLIYNILKVLIVFILYLISMSVK